MTIEASDKQNHEAILVYEDTHKSEPIFHHYPINTNFKVILNNVYTTGIDGQTLDISPPQEVTNEVQQLITQAEKEQTFFTSL
jgi:hypothetical protein